ncbi:hypothetical protein [Trichloromonas sp.]|uniref:hypothetical protein n=1 Tax=Trichloromonas sp. TaxID=3069249 RepID=UPI003D8142EB
MQISRIILCIAYVASMALTADAMPARMADDDSREIHASTSEGYRLSYALAGTNETSLNLAVRHPDGSLVKNAQVVVTLIDRQGRHRLTRARVENNGYRVDTGPHAAELCRVETEIITGGQLLTDHFLINPTT